jgi:hypothetical protein
MGSITSEPGRDRGPKAGLGKSKRHEFHQFSQIKTHFLSDSWRFVKFVSSVLPYNQCSSVSIRGFLSFPILGAGHACCSLRLPAEKHPFFLVGKIVFFIERKSLIFWNARFARLNWLKPPFFHKDSSNNKIVSNLR